ADPADLDWLAQDPYRNETIPATFCAPSTLTGAEERCWEVRLRYRGDLSRLMPKKSWKLFFPAADPFQGQTELNLNADYPDPTLLRSSLAYGLFREVGVPAPQTAFVRLAINDAYAGLYVQVEQVDERFLQRWGFETHGNLYKPYYGGLHREEYDDPAVREWWYRYRYPKKTNRESGIEDIVAFIELINGSSDDSFPQAIAATLDVNEWIDWYAVNVLIGNFEMIEKNYYLYHDFSTDRWTILPWDVDITFGLNVWGTGVGGALDSEISWDNPIDSGTWESKKYDGKWNALIDRMMAVPEFRAFYCRRLRELMETLFSPDHLFPRIDAAFAYIQPWAEADPNRWQPEGFTFADGPAQLKDYITGRIAFLEREMARFCPDRPVPLRINEFMADNDRTAADEAGDYDDWIELYNPSLLTWDLGGMYLTDDLSRTRRWRIPTGTLIAPGGTLLFWADDEEGEGPLHTNFKLSASGEQIGLFDRDVHGNGPVDLITYTTQMTDRAYGRWPDGGEAWRVFDDPTPGWRNEGRPPQITGTAHTPTWPTAHDRVTVTTFVRDDGPALTVTLWYRAYVYGEALPDYQPVPMADDGAHGDGAANDGRFGAVIPFVPHREGYWVEYFVEAEDAAEMVSQDRPGWPQGDYRYITGWQRPPLFINEVMALNTRTLKDEAGEHDDWVEVYNAGPVDLDLGGMFLTDNLDQPDLGNLGDPHLYQVPTGTIVPAGGYLILWADGDGQGSHLSFRLSSAGEYLGLFDRADRFYAPVDAVYFPPQEPDRSWGRFPDGGGAWYAMAAPTPGGPNLLRPPRFVTVTRTPRWPEAGQPVTVTAVVTADSPALTVTLWYSAGAGFQPLPMVGQDGTGAGYRTYTATLPAQPDGTLVAYFLAVTDPVSQSVR
ncbi:MAG TPA: hypothetical protein ENK56_03530, partial [Chloroflexi bacterium]|nr:hypothetical protein [Chloroflexota bacterium]